MGVSRKIFNSSREIKQGREGPWNKYWRAHPKKLKKFPSFYVDHGEGVLAFDDLPSCRIESDHEKSILDTDRFVIDDFSPFGRESQRDQRPRFLRVNLIGHLSMVLFKNFPYQL